MDVRRVAREMRERERAQQARRRAVRTFDGDLDGLSDAASPLFGAQGRRGSGALASPIQLPVGQCITVYTPSFAVPDGGGKVQFSQILENITHGMGNPSLPLTALKAPWSGVTQPAAWGEWLDVDHDSAWRGQGAYGQWLLNDSPVGPQFPARASALPVSEILMPAMTLPVDRRDELSLWLQQDSGTTQNVKMWGSWGMQDPKTIVASDPPPPASFYITGRETSDGFGTRFLFQVDQDATVTKLGAVPLDVVSLTARDGSLFALDNGAHAVLELDPSDGSTLTTAPLGTGGYSDPFGLDVRGSGWWIGDTDPSPIQVYRVDSSLNVVSQFDGGGTDLGALAWDGSELWVGAQASTHTFYVFNEAGTQLKTVDASVVPVGLTFDSAGLVVLSTPGFEIDKGLFRVNRDTGALETISALSGVVDLSGLAVL